MNTISTDSPEQDCEYTKDTILPVRRVSRDGEDYVVQCPHCNTIIGVYGEDMSEIRGEQYQHIRREYGGAHGMRSVGCDGWMEVAENAIFVREL